MNWMKSAAREIAIETNVRGLQWGEQLKEEYIVAAIARHVPATLQIPRCETCAHWTAHDARVRNGLGSCQMLQHSTMPDFGCVQWKKRS